MASSSGEFNSTTGKAGVHVPSGSSSLEKMSSCLPNRFELKYRVVLPVVSSENNHGPCSRTLLLMLVPRFNAGPHPSGPESAFLSLRWDMYMSWPPFPPDRLLIKKRKCPSIVTKA